MDRLGNIEAFVGAAKLGNFTLAARRLRISPSALSRRVAQLEDEIGVRQFHRTTRAVRLSEDGRAFFERARGALRELAEAQDAMSGLRARPAGLLRVEAPTILGRHVLVPALSRFLSRHAEVQIELILRDRPGEVVSDGIDVAVRLGPLEDSALIGRRLGRTRMRVCGAPRVWQRPHTIEERSADRYCGRTMRLPRAPPPSVMCSDPGPWHDSQPMLMSSFPPIPS